MALSGFAKLLLACPEEAISLLRCSIEINRNYPLAHFWLAAALMCIGRPDEARTAAQAGLALSPSFCTPQQARVLVPAGALPPYLGHSEQ